MMAEREVLDVRTAHDWEDWLARNHDEASEIWLRLLNKNAPTPGMSYGEAVEVALCFGWIDSMARKYDEVSRIQRFSRATRTRVRQPTGQACSRPTVAGRSPRPVAERRSVGPAAAFGVG